MTPILIIGPATCGALNVAQQLCHDNGAIATRNAMSLGRSAQIADTCCHAGVGGDQKFSPPRAPFRAPHHTVSSIAILGSRTVPGDRRRYVPGELELASHGVLYLDEVEEFSSAVLLDIMREVARRPEREVLVVAHARTRANFDVGASTWHGRRLAEVTALWQKHRGIIVRGDSPAAISAAIIERLVQAQIDATELSALYMRDTARSRR